MSGTLLVDISAKKAELVESKHMPIILIYFIKNK